MNDIKLLITIVGLLGALSLPSMASAHPHGWVDLRMRIIFDEEGRIETLHQAWRMDPFYSLVLLEELSALDDESSMQQRLDRLGTEILNNLRAQHYFTELTYAGEPVSLGDVTDYTTLVIGQRVEFRFLLPLAEPLELDGTAGVSKALHYKVYDPTYYIEIIHAAKSGKPSPQSLVITDAPQDCQVKIITADPDPAQVMQAAMLDINDTGEQGLGRFFAETGEVICSA